MCRICLEDGGQHFCSCSGSCALVHIECLQKWIDVSHRDSCEICLAKYTFPQKFKCRFHLRLSDVRLSKHTNISVLCCCLGFVLFMLNFFFSLVLGSHMVNIIASNIVAMFLYFFTRPYTNSLQFLLYLSIMTSLGNMLIINKLVRQLQPDVYTFFAQCTISVIFFLTWTGTIIWRDSWVISGINTQ